jgi:hypothetical protein
MPYLRPDGQLGYTEEEIESMWLRGEIRPLHEGNDDRQQKVITTPKKRRFVDRTFESRALRWFGRASKAQRARAEVQHG